MSFQKNSARITLGLQILRTNNEIIKILGGFDQMNGLDANERTLNFKRLIEFMDGQLSFYRPYMKLEIIDLVNGTSRTLPYIPARQYILKILNRMDSSPRANESHNMYWLFKAYNLWSQLLASCYDQLQLTPEEAFKETEGSLTSYGISNNPKED